MSQRIELYDIVKGIGIILVVIGHSINMNSLFGGWIYNFHMPLFFILSGLCFNETKYLTFLSFLKRRFITLLIPFISFIAIFLLLNLLLSINYYSIEKLMDGNWPLAMWFIFVLFCCEIIYYFISKIKSRIVILSILCVCLLFAILLCKYEFDIGYSFSSVFGAIFFYGIGHLLKKYQHTFNNVNNNKLYLLSLLLFIPLLVYIQTNNVLVMSANKIPYPYFLHIIAALCGTCGIFSFARLKICSIVKNVLLFCGKNTLVILCVHLFFMYVSVHYVNVCIHNYLCYKLVEFAIIIMGCLLSIFVINRWLPFLAGKRYRNCV